MRSVPLRRLRLDRHGEVTLLCLWCNEQLPVTIEFWRANEWGRCLACDRERRRLHEAMRRRDAAFRADEAVRSRRYRAFLARECPELLAIYAAEKRSRSRERSEQYRRSRRVA